MGMTSMWPPDAVEEVRELREEIEKLLKCVIVLSQQPCAAEGKPCTEEDPVCWPCGAKKTLKEVQYGED